MMSTLILLFFLFVSSTSSSSMNSSHKCSIQQTLALLQFKQNLSSIDFPISNHIGYSRCVYWLGSEYTPIMVNWNTSIDCCEWNGVTCDHSTGDVIGLDLSCGKLQGIIHPNTTLFNLPYLQRLNLAYNDFTGSQLPPDIGKVSNSLTHLNMVYCGFTGQVPAVISHFSKLVSLDLTWSGINFNLELDVFINMLQNFTVLEELWLPSINISSTLPTNLNISSSLRSLDLSITGLHGTIPHSIFNIQSLEKLDLSANRFTGHIPSDITRLPKLASLNLIWNGIGNLLIQPRVLSTLLQNSTSLTTLYLGEVNISLVLPAYLNISSPLKSLDLGSTNIQGKLPNNIFDLKYLEELNLQENKNLGGPLPEVNASTSIPLSSLDLSGTSLSGEIPASIGHLKSLEILILSDCSFNGSLPNSLATLRNLSLLSLSSNMLSGTLPSSLFSLQSIKALYLANNQLSGQINQQAFQQLTNLSSLNLSYNNFTGEWELDTLFSSLTSLEKLFLSYSGIYVTTSNANHYVNPNFQILSLSSCGLKVFPTFFRAIISLVHLDLSNNDIQGYIPDWVGEIGGSRMSVLNLSNNSLIGTIPNVYANWSGLQGFILNGNKLEGNVPTSLYKCNYLRILDLGNNHLHDTFPGWLGDLPSLEALVLSSNNFHGDIVTSYAVKFPFPNLRVLDLSHNGFTGQLPTKYFQNFNAMKNVVIESSKPEYVAIGPMYYSIIVAVKGVVHDIPRLLVEYTIVDLSNNKFGREIPNIMGNLNSLKVLNLSHNVLSGRIPHELGNISELESLDLSCNQLTGEIPQSLTDLTFLEFLNLSQNHLVGHIPQGKQFNTFEEDSFGGNPKLCGLPLAEKCSDHLDASQLEGEDEEEESGFTWKVVTMGYGCGTLLGFMLGYLMLSTGRPKWFNTIADAIEHMILKRQNKRR